MGNRVVREIDSSRGMMRCRSSASAGRICGIIATVLLGLGLLAVERSAYAIAGGTGWSMSCVNDVRPTPRARPHHKLTDDGRPGAGGADVFPSRPPLHPAAAAAWAAHQAAWVIPVEAVDQPDFALAELSDARQP